jgi:hypothetical protein
VCPTIAEKLKGFAPVAGNTAARTEGPTGNTTLTLVVTNQKMPFWALQRLAAQVHTSMSRAIQPFATEDDGDVLYAVTTDEVENPSLSYMDLSVVASELAWDAVLSSLPEVAPAPALLDRQPAGDKLRKYAGTYELYGGSELSVAVDAGFLAATLKGNGRVYFDANRKYRLRAAANGDFVVDSPAGDVVRFVESAGRITGLTLNPGPWAISARARH